MALLQSCEKKKIYFLKLFEKIEVSHVKVYKLHTKFQKL